MENLANTEHQYSVVSEKFNAIGKLEDICSNCSELSCHCPQHKYKGLLRRKSIANNIEHKYYIKSLYRNNKRGENNTYYTDITIKKKVRNPLPLFTSVPYFNSFGDVCVLENLLDYGHIDFGQCDYNIHLTYLSPSEGTLAEDGTYTSRKIYFTFNNQKYRFDLLNYLPTLQKDFMRAITTNRCTIIEKNDKHIVFKEPDDFAQNIKQQQLQKSLSEMFDKITMNVKGRHKFDYKYEKIIDILITDNFLEYALCAKLCGNQKLAHHILRDYDSKQTKSYYGRSRNYISYSPITGINEVGKTYKEKASKYNALLENLNTKEYAENILNTIKETKIRIFETPLLHIWYEPNWFIYTKKKINKHMIMVCSQLCCCDGNGYVKSAKFKLINAPGEIVKANKELPLLSRLQCFIPIMCKYRLLDSISTIHVTEKRIDQDGDAIFVNHTLKAGAITDGSLQKIYVPLFSRFCKLVRPFCRLIASKLSSIRGLNQ
jgi:hypothetical protein